MAEMNLVHPDVAAENPKDVLYVKGDNITDGSVRVLLGDDDQVPQIERRADGVWNLGELELSRGSLRLGREVALAAVGHHLLVEAPRENVRGLVASSHFNDAGSEAPHIPILFGRQNRVVFQPDFSNDLLTTAHITSFSVDTNAFRYTLYLKVGATAATTPVTFEFTEGVPPNDEIFFRQNFPASKFPANTEIMLDLLPGVTFDEGVQLNMRLFSENAFSLLHDAGGTQFWSAFDLQPENSEDLFSFPTGFNRLVTDCELGEMIFDELGNPVGAEV